MHVGRAKGRDRLMRGSSNRKVEIIDRNDREESLRHFDCVTGGSPTEATIWFPRLARTRALYYDVPTSVSVICSRTLLDIPWILFC